MKVVGANRWPAKTQPTQHFSLMQKNQTRLLVAEIPGKVGFRILRSLSEIQVRLRGIKARVSRPARVLGVVAFGTLLCGCSQTFADEIRENRGCIGEAQIAPERVDGCLRNTDGQRQNVNICLVDNMVPDSKIRMLNDCVDAGAHP